MSKKSRENKARKALRANPLKSLSDEEKRFLRSADRSLWVLFETNGAGTRLWRIYSKASGAELACVWPKSGKYRITGRGDEYTNDPGEVLRVLAGN